MLVGEVLAALDDLAPTALAEDWDNVGLLVGRHNHAVRRVLVALDLRAEVLSEAAERGSDTILVHHPPIFPSLTAVTDDAPASELVLRAAESRMALIAAHTNLDSAAGGLNDVMADALGVVGARPLVPASRDPAVGLGRVGNASPATLATLIARAVEVFAPSRTGLAYVGDPDARVERVAVCTGSGASLIGAARDAGADAYVTGDLKYHDADRAGGMALVTIPHAAVERHVMRVWSRRLGHALAPNGVEVVFADTDTDPWMQL